MPCPLLAAAVFLWPLASPEPKGVYFEQTTVSYVGGHASGSPVRSRVWSSGQMMRLEAGEAGEGPAFVLRLDTSSAFRIEARERRAIALDAARLRVRSQMDLAMAGDLMGADAEARVRVEPLGPSRIIAGLPCQAFRLSQGTTVFETCVAASVGVGMEAFTGLLEWTGADQALGPLMAELRKLPGFPLETVSKVAILGEVHETRSTVTKLEVLPLPKTLFEPPPGYTLVKEEEEREE